MLKIKYNEFMLLGLFLELILKCLFMVQSKYLNEHILLKFFSKFLKAKKSNKWLKIMFYLMSAIELIVVKIWFAHLKALEMRMRNLVLNLSVVQTLTEKIKKINKMFLPKKVWFIDVLSTVSFEYVLRYLFCFIY